MELTIEVLIPEMSWSIKQRETRKNGDWQMICNDKGLAKMITPSMEQVFGGTAQTKLLDIKCKIDSLFT